MLRKRIIFTLIYENGFFHQSRNFRLQRVGNIRWLERNYKFQSVAFSLDELIVLNASKEDKDMQKFAQTLKRLVDNVFIPIAAGGGIRSLEDAKTLFDNGADKIVLNSALFQDRELVKALTTKYGSQSVVASVDYKIVENKRMVFIEDGTLDTGKELQVYLKDLEGLNVGELYLNSIDQDGTGFGYDTNVVEELFTSLKAPLIIAGGAGNEKHLLEGLKIESISAVATANLFNFMGDGLPNARKKILAEDINLASFVNKSL